MTSLQNRLSMGLVAVLAVLLTLALAIGSYSLRQIAERFVATRLEHDLETLLAAFSFDTNGQPHMASEPPPLFTNRIQGIIIKSKRRALKSVPAPYGIPFCHYRRSASTVARSPSLSALKISTSCWSGALSKSKISTSPWP